MTLAEMVAAVAANIGNRTDKNDAIKRWLNEAQQTLVSNVEVKALDTIATVTIASGDEFVPLPTDLRVLFSVRCDGKLLQEFHPRELEHLCPDATFPRTGRPRAYAQTGQLVLGLEALTTFEVVTSIGTTFTVTAEPDPATPAGPVRVIRLFPIPDSTYTLTLSYNRWPRQLVDDTDTCELPIPMVESILIQGATAQAYMHLQQYEDAAMWQRMFAASVKELAGTERKRTAWVPGRVPFRDPTVVSSDPPFDPMIRRWR